MAFAPPFQRPFSASFDRRATVTPWWLSGGIVASNCVAAYQPKGAASLSASYTNLANPGTYDAAPGVAPSFDASTGWTFNGSTQYLNTSIVIDGGSWTMIIRFSGGSTSGGVATALIGNGGRFDLLSNWFNAGVYYRNGSMSNATVSPSISSGTLALTKSKGYRNGAEDISLTADGRTFASTVLIGKANTFFGSVSILAAAIYNTTLSASQIAALSTAMAAL